MYEPVNPNRVTPPLDPGTCVVCKRRNSIPVGQRGKIPAICPDPCRTGWLELLDIASPATHTVEADRWVPFPEVDQVVAEAGPPVTPLTADELAACRRERPAPRPVPGAWLRDRLRGVFR